MDMDRKMRTRAGLAQQLSLFRSGHESLHGLVEDGILTGEQWAEISKEAGDSPSSMEQTLLARRVARHEILRCLSEYYCLPFIEYNEILLIPPEFLPLLDFEAQKARGWCPLALRGNVCEVAVFNPRDELLAEEIKRTLRVERVRFILALPSDIVRILEHNFDVNPGFPKSAGRTPLAELRTWLAGERVTLGQHRTTLAKGRTGLALLRTGVSCISIGLVLLRIFGIGYLTILEGFLIVTGLVMAVDGVRWYLPARKVHKHLIDYTGTEPTFGTTVLQVSHSGDSHRFSRTAPIENADKLRSTWNRLTPVMKRRFLANDRTDLAEERTILASYRTRMARARTGLAFTRTGISFIGLGIALIRQFHSGYWTGFDAALIVFGVLMVTEGFHWNIPERSAGAQTLDAVRHGGGKIPIWDFMFPPRHKKPENDEYPLPLFFNHKHAPGIWGTTGLALERTLIADRRNLKSRLRTIMARSRTGLAFIRTGASIFSTGFALLIYFGTGSPAWTCFDLVLLTIGLGGIIDGLYWHIPAKRIQDIFTHCASDVEIVLADYGKPSANWKKVVLSHEDL